MRDNSVPGKVREEGDGQLDGQSGNVVFSEGLERVEGAAFPRFVKLLASVLMAALVVWGFRVADEVFATRWSVAPAFILVVAFGLVFFCYYWILTSRTSIDRTHIRQTWMWNKEVALEDVAHVKFIAVPYLMWIIAPRMVIRARGRGVLIFHAADPRVLERFARMSLGMA